MIKKMLINASDPEEMRVALVEDGRLELFYAETAARRQTRANIYKGVVANVEPSLQAAFVEYGQKRHGFLQVGDICPELMPESWRPGQALPSIKDILRKGRQILVQVVKEETGAKGAALTTNLSLPGQCLVLTVGRESFGVSRKLQNEPERKRLKGVLSDLKLPERHGIIARTAAEGRAKRDIQSEARMLLRVWKDIERRAREAKAPCLIHQEDDLILRTVRDFFTSDVNEILVDDPDAFSRVERFVSLMNPRRKKAVKLYQAKGPIFGKHELEKQLETIYQPTVSLASGAGIVIQSTEALVSVDVNSGKAIRGRQLEETALNVNLEAAVEIARQLRLRDLGGLIVIDFIDMRERKHQRALHKKLKDELKKDKAKTTVGAVSRFGLIEMSRQRIRPPVDFGATRICPRCQGRGVLLSTEAVGRSVLRNLERKMPRGGRRGLRALLSPEAAHYLLNNKRSELARLESRAGACLEVVADPELTGEQMRLTELTQGWSLPCASGAEGVARDKAEPPAEPPAKDKPRNRKRPPAKAPDKAPAEPPAKDKPRNRKRPPVGARAKAPDKPAAKAPESDGEPARAENEPAAKPPKRRSRRRRSGASRRRAKARRAARNGPETPDKSRDQPTGPRVGPEQRDN